MKKLTLKCINPADFIDFLSRFKVIDNNVLLEIRGNEKLLVKSFTPTGSAIKMGEIDFDEIFEEPKNDIPDNLQLGIFNVDLFIRIFNNIDEDNLIFNIEYEKDEEGKNNENINFVYKFVVKTKSIKMNIPCAEPSIFEYLSDETVTGIFDDSNCVFNFDVTPNFLSKVLNFTSFETSDALTISIKHNKTEDKKLLLFKGKNFTLKYPDEFSGPKDDVEISIDKEYFKFLDSEEYVVKGNDEILLFESKDYSGKMNIAIGGKIDPEDEIDYSEDE